ncbi:MAG: 2-aminomuconate deaminase [Pseudomonadota bacterium]
MPETIQSVNAPKAVGSYPHARRAGNLLFLSGIGPRSAKDNSIPGNIHGADGKLMSYDIAAQCHAVLANVRSVLEACGSGMASLLDVTVYLTDMANDFPVYNRIWAEYFPDADKAPCRTTIGITSLPTPIAIELKCIATAKELTC